MDRHEPLQLWGGIECSMVRIGTEVRDQLAETGHAHRSADLWQVAALGLRTLRYPVLWGRVRHGLTGEDWNWSDARLERLWKLGIAPIVGLLHHGFGPRPDLVLNPLFPEAFADFALAVAQRYPWADAFTPINEPLVTARASGLYGWWYPHCRDEAMCFRLLVAQCRATAKAMAAIRKVSPMARLVQTEDFGRIFATAPLQYQAAYENERRWLTIDLLTGRVDRTHMFYERLVAAGIGESELDEFVAEPCVPDLVGIDYYLTSDRFLDHRLDLYPGENVGGNHLDAYVDIAAVRSACRNHATLASRIDEVWERYHLPLALTEIHNGCTRDEELRWLVDSWQAANAARRRGIDLHAVTAWALFGMIDWNSMLVRQDQHYESGAFDIRWRPPRPTAVAQAIAKLASGESYDHPALDRPGWWLPETQRSKAARRLLVGGNAQFKPIVEECCSSRRLAFIWDDSHSPDLPLARTMWASIHVSRSWPEEANMRMTCRYVDDGQLEVEAGFTSDARWMVHACLDLLIDDCRGKVRLLKAGHSNQYEFEHSPSRVRARARGNVCRPLTLS